MDTITKVLTILINSKQAHLQGKNARLYWNDELEGNSSYQLTWAAGWNVIIWKGKKAVSVYFGQSFDEALDAFSKQESE